MKSSPVTISTCGGGSDPPQENHSATMPPQASIARSERLLLESGSSDESAGSSPAGTAAAASQQLGFTAQHEVASQHDDTTLRDGSARAGAAATRRWSAAITAGSTPRARAQASVSAGVWQQQFVKHCSAAAQPHGLSMQGKGVERSFPASRLAAGESPRVVDTPTGSGNPETTSP
jgi:hypothetical protein